MELGRVEAMFAGKPKTLTLVDGSPMRSAVRKSRLLGPQPVGPDGFPGDGSQERMHHLDDMALHLFSLDRYPAFAARAGRELPPPLFGENLLTRGATEDDVCVGDLLQIGTARLRVTQPTIRCQKLSRNANLPDLLAWINELGYCGLYLRPEAPDEAGGEIADGDPITLLDRPNAGWTITRLHRAMFKGTSDAEKILDLEPLGRAWKHSFRKRAANP